MNAKAEKEPSVIDWIKWLLAAAIVLGSVWGFYHFEEQILTPFRVLGMLIGIGLALLVGATTVQGRAGVAFMKAANIERQKVVWPTRQETVQTTIVVIIVVIIIGILIWMLDLGFSSLVEALVG